MMRSAALSIVVAAACLCGAGIARAESAAADGCGAQTPKSGMQTFRHGEATRVYGLRLLPATGGPQRLADAFGGIGVLRGVA